MTSSCSQRVIEAAKSPPDFAPAGAPPRNCSAVGPLQRGVLTRVSGGPTPWGRAGASRLPCVRVRERQITALASAPRASRPGSPVSHKRRSRHAQCGPPTPARRRTTVPQRHTRARAPLRPASWIDHGHHGPIIINRRFSRSGPGANRREERDGQAADGRASQAETSRRRWAG